MKKTTISSVCECQAPLRADLDEHRHVLRGWATDPRRRHPLVAPAHAIGIDARQFQVGWQCPFCTRNVLRSFDSDGLAWRDDTTSASAS